MTDATAQPSFSITQASSRRGFVTSFVGAPGGSTALLRMRGMSSWCQASPRRKRRIPRRSSLRTDSRLSGVLLVDLMTGRAASMRTLIVTGADRPFWATLHIHAHAGVVASQRERQSWTMACAALMVLPVHWPMERKSNFIIHSSTRPAHVAILTAAVVRFVLSRMAKMTPASL